jgi:hypothetical protein
MPNQIRIDATTLPALIFGGVLVIIAIVMAVMVWRVRRSLDSIVADDPDAELHANRQLRRRWQVSVMLAAVGILIPLGDQLDQLFKQRPILFLAWVSCVLILVLWMVLMALGDWMSTIAYSAVARARLRFERRTLEDEIRRYHAARNGHSLSDSDDML